ncbi:MAG: hypothetical protein NWT02_10780 [Opitutales bacterium]|nr:hypothetical protein [Opitutales bacterium]MDP4777466.1 hypothetical protein [Opitutales bacterium]MDP4884182.1 hypothetical protein [Opitutales bacterium]
MHAKSAEREDEVIGELVAAASSQAKKPQLEERIKRFSLPDDIEERTERIAPTNRPDEVIAGPDRYLEIGEMEVTEIIDLEPAKFIKILQVFRRYVDKSEREGINFRNCSPSE